MPEYRRNAEGADKILRPFNAASPSVPDLKAVPWDDIVAVALSESGSTGVVLVETGAGTVVIKVLGNISLDSYLNSLAHCVGLPSP